MLAIEWFCVSNLSECSNWCCRLDSKGDTSTFTAFWAVPTGVGRSRLMLRFLRSSGTWLRVPTWLFSIATNAFVVRTLGLHARCCCSRQATDGPERRLYHQLFE